MINIFEIFSGATANTYSSLLWCIVVRCIAHCLAWFYHELNHAVGFYSWNKNIYNKCQSSINFIRISKRINYLACKLNMLSWSIALRLSVCMCACVCLLCTDLFDLVFKTFSQVSLVCVWHGRFGWSTKQRRCQKGPD